MKKMTDREKLARFLWSMVIEDDLPTWDESTHTELKAQYFFAAELFIQQMPVIMKQHEAILKSRVMKK